uniref:RING-type E3 ubiquitin transferase n=1 Tax=Timema tahoe TaxID=61484 RepID=A0A7R9IGL4_9NEOP|nr:unnamed protein product [Timema tahoe]
MERSHTEEAVARTEQTPTRPASDRMTCRDLPSCVPRENVRSVPEADDTTTDGGHLYQTLLSIFECPVCLEYIVPPLTGCENGHYVCDSCRPRVRCCPLCRGPIGESRNYRLEALAQELKYPCRNTERGCSQRLVAGKVNQHERSCNYRLYHCPLRHVTRCGWTGVKGKVCSHMSSSHECECGEGGVRRQMRGGRLGSVGGMRLVEYQEEMFLCTSFLSISLSRFIVIVQFIGAREVRVHVAGRFLYTVRFSTKDGKDILLRTATVTSLDLEETCLTGDYVGMDLQEFRGLVRPGNEGLGLVLKVDVLRCYNPLGRSLAQSYDGRVADLKGRMVDFKDLLVDVKGRTVDLNHRLVDFEGHLVDYDDILVYPKNLLACEDHSK